MNMEYRRKQIYEYLKRHSNASVTNLSRLFQVSEMTLRRDLDFLEGQNLISRCYGKAILKEKDLNTGNFEQRNKTNWEAKCAMVEKVIPRLAGMESVYIDSSSTCNYLVELIPPNYNLTVYTNNIFTLNVIIKKPWLKAYVFGGTLSHASQSLDSAAAMILPRDIYVDAALVSCSGFNSTKIFNNDLVSIDERRIMLKNSQERYLLADSTKYNVNGLFTICTWDLIDCFVTDVKPEERLAAALTKNRVELLF